MPILQFKGKTAVETYHHTVPHHTLEFDEKLSVLGKGEKPSLDGNLIIEGDNLLALKALLPTHAGRIKCIYIDPPYNTGNEGWVYNDNLKQPQFKEWIGQTVGKEGEDACRHDKWCCMMYPRLQLLHELLSDDGVIFISIDEREVAHLVLLMDEIFRVNQIAVFVWSGRSGKGATTENVEMTHEYVLCCAKNSTSVRIKPVESQREGGRFTDSKGSYDREQLRQWGQGDRREDRPSMFFPITAPDGSEVYPKRADGSDGRWRVSEASVQRLLDDDDLDFVRDETGEWKVYRKIREGTVTSSAADSLLLDLGSASTGTIELKRIFGGKKVFPTVKPVTLLKHLVDLVCFDDKDATILDSFAGSGTTAHAVMELNKGDSGNRKFILIQMPHDTKEDKQRRFNICEKVTAERIRRVIKGYSYAGRSGKKVRVSGLGGSFPYARVSEKPLFGEYRDLGEQLPAYEEIARYVFYTETSRQFEPAKMDKKTGKIGEHAGTSYYLLYRPNQKEDWALDTEFLDKVAAADANKRLVVYCEKIWIHRNDLREWEAAHGKTVRPMIVPFNLK